MKLKKLGLSLTLISALAFSGCASAPVDAEVSAISVELTTAGKGNVETSYIYSGKTAPIKEATVLSAMNGIVKKVNFEIGDAVEEGAVLFQMDTKALETSLKGQQANYSSALAGIETSKINLESVEGAQSQLQIEKSKTAYDDAKKAYENVQVLFDQGFASQSELDNAENGVNQAKQAYDIASTSGIEEGTKKAEAGLNASKAQANAVAAQIEATKNSLADASVKSPISGVVTGKNVMEGVMLSNSAVPFTISDMSSVIVKVSVSEQLINSLAKGQIVAVKIASVSQTPMEATVKTINPAANQSGTYDVEIEIPNTSGNVKSGMFAEVSFNKEKGYNSIVLPRDAVIEKNNETYVFIEKEGIVTKVNVVTGVDDGATVQVIKGVEESDKVVTKGQSYLAEGDTVKVVATDGVRTDTPGKKGE